MSEFISMSPFVLPLLPLVILLGGIWRHDTAYQLQEARASKARQPMSEEKASRSASSLIVPLDLYR